ncbi:hypothetical protein FANTH_986 [Fusarium anthophilum]|uniref:Biotin carboxylation domain-containing protein n=1 Tax=Fusarium anthophilum TaxID=48485 RepID=A0A8H5EBF0_9HYPO|nr:hypothetical protein FANTH_986 [Fusarium anthophilum]
MSFIPMEEGIRFRGLQIEAILEAENIVAVLRMAFTSRRITIHITPLCWFLVFVASQIGLAVLGLFYSVDVSDKLALQVMPGNVSIANMSAVQPLGFVFSNSQSRSGQEYTANMYGIMSLTYINGARTLEPEIGDLRLASDPVLFCDSGGCDFVFLEASVLADPGRELADMASWQLIMVATNRRLKHDIPEHVRLLAAQAIALQGFSVNTTLSDSDLQHQVYPAQSPFGTPLQGMVQAM